VSKFIKLNKLEFVGLQEMKKYEFSISTLNLINRDMNWNYMPVVDTTSGILVGFKKQSYDILSWQYLKYCTMTIVRSKVDNFTWSLIVVYGSPYEETKQEFLDELNYIMGLWLGPTMVGDFNLVRKQEEKSNRVINHHHVDIFNEWISNWALIEIKDHSRKFT
jgi:hypothetical protein